MTEPIRDTETAVREMGALPAPVGTADLTAEQRAAIAELIGDARPATARLVQHMAQAVHDRATHEHPAWEDLYCLNLVSWLGERMAPVLRRLVDAEARVAELETDLAAKARDAEAAVKGWERARERLAEYERPADEDPIRYTLTEHATAVALPPATVRCGCGHPGSEYHHVGVKCWARLPRALGQPVRICPCERFAPVSVGESADRLAQFIAPTEGGAV
ncbi:hypothetical protein ACH4C6_21840 [Streptomyces sp. NPDC017943]|uniref:hypothetical protein n=1 Tax=Streptomyces sp. NPDC017943 TaxID=3365019 RepID=UPI0037B76D1C